MLYLLYQTDDLSLSYSVLLLEESLKRVLELLHEWVRRLQHCWHRTDWTVLAPSAKISSAIVLGQHH